MRVVDEKLAEESKFLFRNALDRVGYDGFLP